MPLLTSNDLLADAICMLLQQWNKAVRRFEVSQGCKVLKAWRSAAADLRQAGTEHAELAEGFYTEHTGARAMLAWHEYVDLKHQQREALWKAMVVVMMAEQQVHMALQQRLMSASPSAAWPLKGFLLLALQELLTMVLTGWRERTAVRISVRAHVVDFVNRRRLSCLSDYFTVWQQFTAAMKSDLNPASPLLGPRSGKQDRRLIRRMAAMRGSPEVSATPASVPASKLQQVH